MMLIQYLFHVFLILFFSYVDSQRGDIKRDSHVYNNLCVMIKTDVQSEVPLFEQVDVDSPFC